MSYGKIVIFSLITLTSPLTSAQNSRPPCQESLLTGDSMWVLPPHGEKIFVGLLAKNENDDFVFIIGDYYLGSHSYLMSVLETIYQGQNLRIEWAGEIRISNPQDRAAQGQISESINTSGYIWKKTHEDANVRNTPEALVSAFQRHWPDRLALRSENRITKASYSHLDKSLQTLTDDQPFDSIATRHYLQNQISAAALALEKSINIKPQHIEWLASLVESIRHRLDHSDDRRQLELLLKRLRSRISSPGLRKQISSQLKVLQSILRASMYRYEVIGPEKK